MIHLKHIRFTYDDTDSGRAAGKHFELLVPELRIAQGERVAIVGPSGSGKSTLLNLISGIEQVDEGTCVVDGMPLHEMGDAARKSFRRRHLGFVFQDIALFDYLSVVDNVLLTRRLNVHSLPAGEATARAMQLLTDVGMSDKKSRKPGHLSQGERQRVAICRAMLLKPRLLLADEPTSNLDEGNSDVVCSKLLELSRQEGMTLIMLTHDLRLLKQFDRVIDIRELKGDRPASNDESDTSDIAEAEQAATKREIKQSKMPAGQSGSAFSLICKLALGSLWHDRKRSGLMIGALLLTLLLPLMTFLMIRTFQAGLTGRAASTPLVVGPRGSELDLVFKLLYFRTDTGKAASGSQAGSRGVTYGDHLDLVDSDVYATVIPLMVRHTIDQRLPLVGTDADYFLFRQKQLAHGSFPAITGEAVMGWRAARHMMQKLKVDRPEQLIGLNIRTDVSSLHDLSRNLSVSLRVTGIFKPGDAQDADDQAVFVSLPTTWVIEGLGHGHTKAEDVDASRQQVEVASETGEKVTTLTGAVRNEVTIDLENIDQVHFHGDQRDFPLSGMIVVPETDKARVILTSRINERKGALQAASPLTVIELLLGKIFRLGTFFYITMAVVAIAMGLLMLVVGNLVSRLRQNERLTLERLGAPNHTWPGIMLTEHLSLILLACVPLAFFYLWMSGNQGVLFRYLFDLLR